MKTLQASECLPDAFQTLPCSFPTLLTDSEKVGNGKKANPDAVKICVPCSKKLCVQFVKRSIDYQLAKGKPNSFDRHHNSLQVAGMPVC